MKETLDKEIDLLQTIDRLKIAAGKDQKVQKIEKYLKAMSDPKQWVRYYCIYSDEQTDALQKFILHLQFEPKS